MTRYVVDLSAMLYLVERDFEVSDQHRLLAPTLLRSQILSELYSAVRHGDLEESEAWDRLQRFGKIKMRLLGDAVLRRRAWEIARQLDLDGTFDAEYVALTQLQADALVTNDEQLRRKARGLVDVATVDVLGVST